MYTKSVPDCAPGLPSSVIRCRRRFLSARGVLPRLLHANMDSRKYLQTILKFQANNTRIQLAVFEPRKAERLLINHCWSLPCSNINAAIEGCIERSCSVPSSISTWQPDTCPLNTWSFREFLSVCIQAGNPLVSPESYTKWSATDSVY
jgi:hypothetical protein